VASRLMALRKLPMVRSPAKETTPTASLRPSDSNQGIGRTIHGSQRAQPHPWWHGSTERGRTTHSSGCNMVEIKWWARLVLGAHHDFVRLLGRGGSSAERSIDGEGRCGGTNSAASTRFDESYDATRK
jgi:hypothetical protein